MLVTEEEAKTKRCQESFGDSNLGSGYIEPRPLPPDAINYSPAGFSSVTTSPAMCIGSACMAWRWRESAEPAQYEECITFGGVPTHASDWELVSGDDGNVFDKLRWRRLTRDAQPARGFCGKSGTLYRFD